MGFSSTFISTLKGQIDINSLVSEYLKLDRSGTRYKGLCPFHQEKTPSFHVNPDTGLFYCFGCHTSGDTISFVEKIENLEFADAVKFLAEKYNIELEYTQGEQQERSLREEILQVLNYTTEYYQLQLKDNLIANQYLRERILNDYIVKTLKIGFAEGTGLISFLKNKGIKRELIEQAGLMGSTGGEKFKRRLMFPIENLYGKVVGFGGRIIEEIENAPKYLNSPATQVFEKRKMLYGLNLTKDYVRKLDYIIIVEGYMDFAALYQEGVVNIAASLGTSFTEQHASLLKRFTKNVYLCFDADVAGMKAALKSFEVLAAGGLFVYGIALPKGSDPDDYIKEFGKESFMMLKENAEEIPFFLINSILKEVEFKKLSLPGKLEKLAPVLKAISVVSDKIRQSYYIKDLALKLGISEKNIASQIKSGLKHPFHKKNIEEVNPLSALNSTEKTLLILLMNKPELKEQVKVMEDVLRGLPIEPYFRQLMDADFKKISEVIDNFSDDLKLFLTSSMDDVTVDIDLLLHNIEKDSVLNKIKIIKEKINDFGDTLTDDELGNLIIEKTQLQKKLHKL